jgi:pimeloyl-ACP methyl ester carboxylesterase
VLVHGAWADGSSWARVTARLQRAGYTVHVPPNPLRGLASDSAYLASFLGTIKGPIVLVGHSYGGSVITDAATGNSSVRALVYVNAFIPDEGETVLELAGAEPGSKLSDAAKAFDVVPYPGAVGGDVDLYVKPSVFHADFAGDQSEEAADALAAVQRPLAASALQAESTAPAWKTIRSWAVVGTEDQVIPPAEQIVMAHRAGAETTKVAAAHLSMASQPGVVARVILRATAAD